MWLFVITIIINNNNNKINLRGNLVFLREQTTFTTKAHTTHTKRARDSDAAVDQTNNNKQSRLSKKFQVKNNKYWHFYATNQLKNSTIFPTES